MSILISQLISFVFIIIEWRLRLVPRKFSFSYFKKILRFGLFKQISETSNRIFFYILSILILYNLSKNEYAEFFIANSIALILIFILSNISVNYQPHISTLRSLNTKESEKLIKRDIENTIKIFIFVAFIKYKKAKRFRPMAFFKNDKIVIIWNWQIQQIFKSFE